MRSEKKKFKEQRKQHYEAQIEKEKETEALSSSPGFKCANKREKAASRASRYLHTIHVQKVGRSGRPHYFKNDAKTQNSPSKTRTSKKMQSEKAVERFVLLST